jgi:hypothetical protein
MEEAYSMPMALKKKRLLESMTKRWRLGPWALGKSGWLNRVDHWAAKLGAPG